MNNMKKELDIVKKRKEIVNNNNIETLNMNMNMNMVLAYGKEDISLTEAEMKKLVLAGYNSVPKYVEMMHRYYEYKILVSYTLFLILYTLSKKLNLQHDDILNLCE